MAGESISIPILTPGADAAARNIKQVGDAAAGTGAKLDFAAGSMEAWNRAAANSAKADATSVNALKTHAKATALLADAENVLAGKATTTTKLFADQQKKLDDSGKSATTLASRFSALAGTGGFAGGGMGALIGAGIALSGQISAVGLGLGGLALAAYGVAKPIETAAQATGGLQKNLHTLNPEQQAVARSLLGLEHQYDAFQKSLSPQILTGFNDAIRIAGHVMGDLQPIAKQAGNALDGVLLSVDKEFQSGTWQQFFRFLAQQAGPDVRLLGQNFTDLLQALPPLIQDLNPLGNALLHVSDDALKAAGGVAKFYQSFEKNVPISNQNVEGFFQRLDAETVRLTNHLGPWARAINNSGTGLQHLAGDGAPAVKSIAAMVTPAQAAARELQATATATKNLMTAQQNALNTQTTYAGDLVTTASDASSLQKALKASHDEIGLHTAIQRASFSAANQYITDLGNTATQAYDSGHGVDASIKAITKGLPILDSAKTKNRAYWQEVQTLVGWLDKLKQIKAISVAEKVFASGNWTVTGAPHGVPGSGGKLPSAAGRLVTGGIPGKDSVPILAMPGEAVVPTRLTPAVAPFLKAHGVPGFASGGVVGSYTGTAPGLVSWNQHNLNTTLLLLEQATARATLAGLRAAAAIGGGAAGPGGGAPAANAALAQRLYASQLTPADWSAWNAVAMAESGWNQFARNPSSGAYGIPQALPPSKMGAAANPPESNPAAQINWMWNYMRASYGGPLGAEAHENAFHWYDRGGLLPRGLSLALNTTGRPERVLGPGQGGNTYNISVHVPVSANKADTGRQVVEAIKEFERRSGAGWRN